MNRNNDPTKWSNDLNQQWCQHYPLHPIRADKSRNTQFIDGGKKLEVLLVFTEYLYLASGWNWTSMWFGSMCDIKQSSNEMLASCESEMNIRSKGNDYTDITGEQPPGKEACQMECAELKRAVHSRCWRSVEWNRVPNPGWEEPTVIEEHQI